MPYGPKRMTKEKVKEIRNLYFSGNCTQKDLSLMYDISQSQICKIVNNISHKPDKSITISGEATVRIGYRI